MAQYRVTCQDCGLEMVFDDGRPPVKASVDGSEWSAQSAAEGAAQGHSTFHDYSIGSFHTAEVVDL